MGDTPERFPVRDARVRRVRVSDDVSLRILERGDTASDKPVFVLVHGLASNARMWDGVGQELQRRDWPSIAVDLRGHGLSDKPDSGYDFDTVAHDLVTLVRELDLSRMVIVGQSWGGNVVVHALHRHPDVFTSGVAVDGGFIELGAAFESWSECAERMQPPRLAGTRSTRLESAIRAMNSDWPETGILGSLSNFQLHDDGTISPWLTFERHMKILEELWRHSPSTLFGNISQPLLFLPADSGDVAWTRNKERALAGALDRLERGRVHWFRPAHHDLHAQFPDATAEVLISNVLDGFLT